MCRLGDGMQNKAFTPLHFEPAYDCSRLFVYNTSTIWYSFKGEEGEIFPEAHYVQYFRKHIMQSCDIYFEANLAEWIPYRQMSQTIPWSCCWVDSTDLQLPYPFFLFPLPGQTLRECPSSSSLFRLLFFLFVFLIPTPSLEKDDSREQCPRNGNGVMNPFSDTVLRLGNKLGVLISERFRAYQSVQRQQLRSFRCKRQASLLSRIDQQKDVPKGWTQSL